MTLTSLPNELIEHITSYLDLPSTRSLRLTTSSLTRASSHLFRDRFFQQRTLIWTKQSLDTFVQISLHPQYGNALRHLIIDATPRHSILLWSLSKQTTDMTPFPNSASASSSSSSRTAASAEQCRLQDAWAQATEKAAQNTSFFNETRYDQKRLKQAFANMWRGNLTTITFLYTGLPASLVKGGRRYCTLSQCETSRPFVSTLAALAASPHMQLSTIGLHEPFHHGAVSIGRLESLAPLLSSFDKAFRSLTHLALNLRDWREPESGFQLAHSSSSSCAAPRAPFIVRFLAKMTHLTSLQLSCYSHLEPHVFGEIASHCRFDRLAVCKLSVVRMERVEWLDTFLRPSLGTTLRELCLRQVMLAKRPGHGWREWMKRMALEQRDLGREGAWQGQGAATGITHFCFADLFTGQSEVLHVQRCRSLCLGEDWTCRLLSALEGGAEGKEWRPQWDMGASAYPFVGLSM